MTSNYTNKSTKKPKPKAAPASSSPVGTARDKTPGERMAGYGREQRHPSGSVWKRIVASVVSHYGGICHLCGHPGALQADHLLQYAEGGDDSIGNLRPAHGVANTQKNRCPTCGLACNNIRGNLSVEAGKRKIAKRMGDAPPPEPEGREW